MAHKFLCTNCGNKLVADPSLAGKRVACPHCKSGIAVPPLTVDTKSTKIRIARPIEETTSDENNILKPPAHPTAEIAPSLCRAGTKIGNFEIGYLLGAGTMGQVFLAKQLSMDRQVALKILPPAIMNHDSDAVDQFMNEVRLLAKLDHANIATAFEAGEDKGMYYLAMAFIDGETVEVKLDRGETFEEKEGIRIISQAAQALKYAWEDFKMLHQDIKPGNLMIDKKNEVKLMDMGIARISTRDQESDGGTAQFVLGTPFYMSPEQATGRLDLDWRSDQYSLGCTLFHILTGRYPFPGDEPADIMRAHVNRALPSPKSVNPKISDRADALIRKMMAKSPDRRFQTWEELIKEFEAVQRGVAPGGKNKKRPSTDKRPSVAKRRSRPTRTRVNSRPMGYVRAEGPSVATAVSIFFGCIFAFYLLLAILNRSGILEGMDLRFPQNLFPPPFRVKLSEVPVPPPVPVTSYQTTRPIPKA